MYSISPVSAFAFACTVPVHNYNKHFYFRLQGGFFFFVLFFANRYLPLVIKISNYNFC